MRFADHFSGHAADYARFRPHYPAALFSYLATLAPTRALAWDCGTGSGQAAVGLAGHFAAVLATDASSAQLAQVESHPHITYRVGPESHSGLPDRTADLVTAAQALHWFEVEAFYAEVRRVLRPDGAVAVWCYGLPRISASVDPPLREFYTETVGPYWPPERRQVDLGYRSIPFPFPEVPTPSFEILAALDLESFGHYLHTWSAVMRYQAAHAGDPVGDLLEKMAPSWGSNGEVRPVRWPISMRVGRMTGEAA
jgi:SAM-dependent methyltransferase